MEAKKRKQNFSPTKNKKAKCESEKAPKINVSSHDVVNFSWDEVEEISYSVKVPERVVGNVVKLLDEENTVPFIARYRKNVTGSLEPEIIFEIQSHLKDLRKVKDKGISVLKSLEKIGKLDDDIQKSILSSKTQLEIAHLYEPYQQSGKNTLAARAKALGLEELSYSILNGNVNCKLGQHVDSQTEGKSNIEELKKGIQHILAEVISKDKEILELARDLAKDNCCRIVCKKRKKSTTAKEKSHSARPLAKAPKKMTEQLFENYFDFDCAVNVVKSHQILAINRGVANSFLTVKIVLPDKVRKRFEQLCHSKWLSRHNYQGETLTLMKAAVEDCYKRLIGPLIMRQVKSSLTQAAEKESVMLFGKNLRRLLMTPPVKNKVILGIDPGFRNGCKLAVISTNGSVITTDVINPHTGSRADSIETLSRLIRQHGCETVALGNGTACRDTEKLLSELFGRKSFAPLSPKYTIVNEQGASIYSCSKEAKEEFGQLDSNVISAVSIARRLQDPLSEYLKVDVKNLGIGMYQHDVAHGLLSESLNEVVTECVSFVGVDLNTCSEQLLCHVAGLTKARARSIVGWRQKNGSFINREQLNSIKGIGPKSYRQCAGFIRVLAAGDPKSAAKSRAKPNFLDRTNIHPESYSVAESLMADIGISSQDIGSQVAVKSVSRYMKSHTLEGLAKLFQSDVPTMSLIVDALQQTVDFDIRSQFEQPLFKTTVTSMEQLERDSILTGKVNNVTSFGAFVDLGVETDGLIHVSQMGNCVGAGKSVGLGQKVEVRVISVDRNRKRIALQLLSVLSEF